MNVDAVFKDEYPSLFRYLHRLTGDFDVAEDIAQEAFVRLLDQRLPQAEARPWLFTVATNLVRDRGRRGTRQRRLQALVPAPSPVTALDAHEQMEQDETIGRIRGVLAGLPDRDRQMLLMREEGFRYGEIAEAIGVAASSVGTLLTRALRRFKEAYDAYDDGNTALS